MDKFSTRLLYFIENQLHMSVREFEKINDFPHSTIQRAINGTNLGVDKIQLIGEKYPNLNMDWLLNGDGDVFDKEIVEISPVEKALLKLTDSIHQMVENTTMLISNNSVLIKSNEKLVDTNSLLSQGLKRKEYGAFDGNLSIVSEP